jgi:hypothetical protein
MERFRVIFKKNGTPAIQGALTGSLTNLLRDGFRGPSRRRQLYQNQFGFNSVTAALPGTARLPGGPVRTAFSGRPAI